MITLYDRDTSGNAYKVRLLLAFLGVSYQRVPVALKDGKNLVDDAYRALNPRAQIPTLVHDDIVLWGSTAALCYVATTCDPARRWLPSEPHAFAQVMQWLELAQNEVQTGLFQARAIARFGYMGDLSDAQAKARVALHTLEQRLANNAWLVGSNPTIADIACFPYAALAEEGHVSLAPYPAVRGWIEAIRALPSFVGMPGL